MAVSTTTALREIAQEAHDLSTDLMAVRLLLVESIGLNAPALARISRRQALEIAQSARSNLAALITALENNQ